MSKYLNREQKNEVIVVAAITGYLITKIPEWEHLQYPKTLLEQARRSKTHLEKTMHEMLAGVDDYQGQKLINDVDQHEISVKPKATAKAQRERFEKVLDSVVIEQNQLLDYADMVVSAYCVNCKGTEDCHVRKLLLETGVEVVDRDNAVCPYQIKEG